MKLADRTVEIHSQGIDSSNQFSIAQTSKMFKILSDSLYSDKVMAVIRELSTNANDAHVAAGNRNPFKVILPTEANPNFTVRDYGTGLSQEDMEELYTTYGASNKNDSNDFTGCLGLGSKSPFAYTKSFSTTSYHNGKAYNYIAAMDEAGVPSLSLFGITETDEPNGLEISFAVKRQDYDEFTQKAKRIFHYFKTRPILEGGTSTNLEDHEYSHSNIVIEGDGWKVGKISQDHEKYPSEYNSPGAGVVAVMGNIAYPVDSDKIIGEQGEKKSDAIQAWNRTFKKADVDSWTSLVKEILNSGFYLEMKCEIGELEMDVSREGLQYTKDVVATLRKKTQEIYLQLKRDMSTKIALCTNIVDAYQTYYKISDITGGYTTGAAWTDPEGVTHELSAGTDLEYKLDKNKQLYAVNYRSASYRSKRMLYLTDRIHHESLQGKSSNYWDKNRKTHPLTFFVCDTRSPETAKKIVIKYCNQNDCMAYLMIDTQNPAEDSGEGFTKLLKDMGGETKVLNVSDYRDLIKNNSKSSRGKSGSISKDEVFICGWSKDVDSTCKKLTGNNLNDSMYLRELNDALAECLTEGKAVIYIPISRYKSTFGFPNIHRISSLARSTESKLGQDLFKRYNVFAIKESAVNKLKKQGLNLVDFNKWFKAKAGKISKTLREDVGCYEKVIAHIKAEYMLKDMTNSYRWSNKPEHSDRVIAANLLNIYGLEYRKSVQDKSLCKALDEWLMFYFFAEVCTVDYFNIKAFTRKELEAQVDSISSNYGIKHTAADIHKKTRLLENLLFEYKKLYNLDTLPEKGKYSDEIIKTLPTMENIRKIFKAAIDKSPMMKYIVSSNHEIDIQQVKCDPMSVHDTGYGNRNEWLNKIDVDGLRESLGKLV